MKYDRKNFLLIGNPDSIWVKKYIEKIILPDDQYTVYIADVGQHTEGLFSEFYHNNGVKIYRLKEKNTKRIPFVSAYMNIKKMGKLLRKQISPAIVHAHYITWQSMFLLGCLKNKNTVTVASYWGSDILRESKSKLTICRLWIGKVDKITLTTAEMRRKFAASYGDRYITKIHTPFFGVNGYDTLNDMSHDSGIYKAQYGADPENVTVTVGYNGSRAQQHLRALEAINHIDKMELRNLFIIVPMTYGISDNKYIDEVADFLRGMNVSGFKVLTDYMNDEESSNLKCVTDIFIHAQTTDAFSASVQEFLYAEKIVLNPTWIKYDEHEEKGIFFIKYDSFDNLTSEIEKCIRFYESGELVSKLKNNNEILKSETSWEAVTPYWRILYK